MLKVSTLVPFILAAMRDIERSIITMISPCYFVHFLCVQMTVKRWNS